jgi:hypothetical protein
MYKYLLFAYVPRFGGKGGMNDLILKFNSHKELVFSFNDLLLPTDAMYSYHYQLVNTNGFITEEFISKSGYEREGKDSVKITMDRIGELQNWFNDMFNENE